MTDASAVQIELRSMEGAEEMKHTEQEGARLNRGNAKVDGMTSEEFQRYQEYARIRARWRRENSETTSRRIGWIQPREGYKACCGGNSLKDWSASKQRARRLRADRSPPAPAPRPPFMHG